MTRERYTLAAIDLVMMAIGLAVVVATIFSDDKGYLVPMVCGAAVVGFFARLFVIDLLAGDPDAVTPLSPVLESRPDLQIKFAVEDTASRDIARAIEQIEELRKASAEGGNRE